MHSRLCSYFHSLFSRTCPWLNLRREKPGAALHGEPATAQLRLYSSRPVASDLDPLLRLRLHGRPAANFRQLVLEQRPATAGSFTQRPPATSTRSAGAGSDGRGEAATRLAFVAAALPFPAGFAFTGIWQIAPVPAHSRYGNLTLQPRGPAPSAHSGQSQARAASAFSSPGEHVESIQTSHR
ncbi:hypothetical protein MHYP_G00106790 [Metynnis hypsauchen]